MLVIWPIKVDTSTVEHPVDQPCQCQINTSNSAVLNSSRTDLNAVDLPAARGKIALVAEYQNRDVFLLPVPLNVSPNGVGEL